MASPQILFGNRQQQKSHVDLGTVQDCVGMGQSALKNNNIAKKTLQNFLKSLKFVKSGLSITNHISTLISACLNFTFLQISENSVTAVVAMSDIIFSGHRRAAGI